MSAIIITTTPHPRSHPHTESRSTPKQAQSGSERTPLLRPPSPSGSCTSSTSSYSSSSDTLFRSPPLKDSISLARFVTVCIGIWSSNFVFAFQSTAIPTLAPAIGSWFQHAELSAYLGSAFTLANTAVIPLYGVLMETLGRKFAMVTACAFYAAGTVMCALAGDMYILIAARAFAGLGGGGLLTVSSVIVTDLVPLRDRGFYQGLMMTIFGSGSMLGGPIAGWLTDRYGWHWSFWVQLPVTIFCAIIVSTFLPTAPIPPTHQSLLAGLASLDWLGSFFLISSVTTLILGFSFHTSYLVPWSSPLVWGMLIASVVTGAAFIITEQRVQRPVVPLSLLKSNHIAAIMGAGFFLSIGNQAFTYQIPVYFSVIINTSTAQAGLIVSLCGGLGLATGSMVAGQYIRAGHPWGWLAPISLVPPIIGGVVAAYWTVSWPWWSYYATVLPCVLGYSTFLCVQLVALVSSVDSKVMPKATALMYTTRSLGATLGVSIGGSIQLGALASSLNHQFKGVENKGEIISAILHSKSALQVLPPSLRTRAISSYAHSLSVVWWFSVLIALITFISSFWIRSADVHKLSAPTKIASGSSPDGYGTSAGGEVDEAEDGELVDEERAEIDDRVKSVGGGAVDGAPFGTGLGEASIEGETGTR